MRVVALPEGSTSSSSWLTVTGRTGAMGSRRSSPRRATAPSSPGQVVGGCTTTAARSSASSDGEGELGREGSLVEDGVGLPEDQAAGEGQRQALVDLDRPHRARRPGRQGEGPEGRRAVDRAGREDGRADADRPQLADRGGGEAGRGVPGAAVDQAQPLGEGHVAPLPLAGELLGEAGVDPGREGHLHERAVDDLAPRPARRRVARVARVSGSAPRASTRRGRGTRVAGRSAVASSPSATASTRSAASASRAGSTTVGSSSSISASASSSSPDPSPSSPWSGSVVAVASVVVVDASSEVVVVVDAPSPSGSPPSAASSAGGRSRSRTGATSSGSSSAPGSPSVATQGEEGDGVGQLLAIGVDDLDEHRVDADGETPAEERPPGIRFTPSCGGRRPGRRAGPPSPRPARWRRRAGRRPGGRPRPPRRGPR